ncbi:hypothetical protein P5673_028132 [Acropora cervicornis]|uniref:Ig-like domain-containing protein n=1 Tax=Acropora cervicornis TaxID=6130 RepID=A0AAD9PXV0_ACRCE|nr:hypothetical protein P5673_028132 [Acropora cervicornis]
MPPLRVQSVKTYYGENKLNQKPTSWIPSFTLCPYPLLMKCMGPLPVVASLHALAVFWKRKTFVVFESEIYRRIYKRVLVVAVEELSEAAGRRKRIESESPSGMLYKRQEKVMEKTITKLCLMLAMLHLVRMADAMAIESKGDDKINVKVLDSESVNRNAVASLHKNPVIAYFGLQNGTGIAFIGNTINLTCIMENTDEATFLKSDDPVDESKRVTYFYQGSGNKLYGNLEISEVKKNDSGVYTCVAYRAGIVATREFFRTQVVSRHKETTRDCWCSD